jgi:uncharacterized RDD family membrane protein YckC
VYCFHCPKVKINNINQYLIKNLKNNTNKNCSLIRRLAAILYDSILLFSVFFFATFILISLIANGEIESGNPLYTVYLIILAYLYFCWHWVKGRQTLGMNCWSIFVVTDSNASLNWKQASFRYFASLLSLLIFGLGFIWALFDKEKITLHDRLSKTKLIVNKKNE